MIRIALPADGKDLTVTISETFGRWSHFIVDIPLEDVTILLNDAQRVLSPHA